MALNTHVMLLDLPDVELLLSDLMDNQEFGDSKERALRCELIARLAKIKDRLERVEIANHVMDPNGDNNA